MRIYLDHNATTPMCVEAREAMNRAALSTWGNPSSVHAEGQTARAAIEGARAQVARCVGAKTGEIVFTSGATEANNWVFRRLAPHGAVITSSVEHPSVASACQAALDEGRLSRWVQLPVDGRGRLDLDDLKRVLDDSEPIALVSVMATNNEVGNHYPIEAIATLCREHSILVHCDATQRVGREPVDLASWGVDLASFSAHKLYGPKGIGALYVREGTPDRPWLVGGHQERARRAGTENVLGVVGFGAAAAASRGLAEEARRQAQLRDRLESLLAGELDGLDANGDRDSRAANTCNISFLGCEAEQLLIALDLEGVSVSAGSACSAGSLEPSPVICAMTEDDDRRRSAVRFSLGRGTSRADIDEAAARVVKVVRRIRR